MQAIYHCFGSCLGDTIRRYRERKHCAERRCTGQETQITRQIEQP